MSDLEHKLGSIPLYDGRHRQEDALGYVLEVFHLPAGIPGRDLPGLVRLQFRHECDRPGAGERPLLLTYSAARALAALLLAAAK